MPYVILFIAFLFIAQQLHRTLKWANSVTRMRVITIIFKESFYLTLLNLLLSYVYNVKYINCVNNVYVNYLNKLYLIILYFNLKVTLLQIRKFHYMLGFI